MTNYTVSFELPPLPAYTLQPLPPLISWIPDKYLTLVLPIVGYWVVSIIFHLIDTYDVFPQYRLHTPEELLKRNHATRWDVVRDVIVQQIIQTLFGLGIAYFDPEPLYGKEDYDVAQWAQRIRTAQRAIPFVLSLAGANAGALASKIAGSHPILAGALAGGQYSFLTENILVDGQKLQAPAFAPWEILLAKAIYWVGIPAVQFFVAIVIVDTWQYFLHRAMHMNKTLYGTYRPL
jgi:sphinganine C4-monooxygenase